MKFSLILTMATGAMAAVLHGTPTKRDGASISSAVSVVSASVAALDTAINGFSGASNAAALQSASDAVLSAINAGTTVASASTPLSTLEALGLVTPINDLVALVNTTITDAIAKKPAFDAAGVSSVVLKALQDQKTASQAFSAAIIAQLPTDLQPTGQNLAQPIIDSLNNGIAAFSAAPVSSTTSAAAATTTAAASTTAAAPPTTTPAGPATTPASPPTTQPAGPGTTAVNPPPYTTPAGGQPGTTAVNPPPYTTPAGGQPATTPAAPPAGAPTTAPDNGGNGGNGGHSWGGWGWGQEHSTGQWGGWGWGQHHSTFSTSWVHESKPTGWGQWDA